MIFISKLGSLKLKEIRDVKIKLLVLKKEFCFFRKFVMLARNLLKLKNGLMLKLCISVVLVLLKIFQSS